MTRVRSRRTSRSVRFARFVLREVIEQAPSKQTALDLLPGLAPGGFGRRGPRMWREETPVMAAQFKHRFPLADFAVADHQRIFRQQQAPAQFFEIVQTDAAIVAVAIPRGEPDWHAPRAEQA